MSRLLLVSSRAPFFSSLDRVVLRSVCVISYDYESATLSYITGLVSESLGQRTLSSLALLLHCNSTHMFICSQGSKVLSCDTVQYDASVQQFLKELSSHLSTESAEIHVFNSPLQVDFADFTTQMGLLLDYPVHLVTDLFEPANQQAITQLYFHISELKSLLRTGDSKVTSLDGYEKIRTVGKGAFGTAVLYRKVASDCLVVIKETNMMELSGTERQMALNEVQVLSSLHHPNIIRYLGSFELDCMLMIEMEYADGGTLAQLISRSSRLSERQVLSLFLQCVGAIQYMHQNNILHRDLKTANVFLTKDKLIKVGDFGISKVMTTKGQAQTVLGTPYYISPEMCEGKQYDHKSDVWALGCILYEMACLQKTFQGNNLPALVNKIMKGTFEPVPNVYSQGLRDLVTDLLQKEPASRPTAAETYRQVKILLDHAEMNTVPTVPQKGVRSVLYQLSGSGVTFSCVPVPLPPTLQITQVAVSNTHYITVSADMKVFTWGEGKRGQLGHPEAAMWLQKPTPVQALADKSICAVGAGDGFSVFLSDSGVLLTCGDGTFGCLGHGDWSNVSRPRLVERLLNEEVRKMACGDHHCVALTGVGGVYTWGRGEWGQLGTGQELDCCVPTELSLKTSGAVSSVHCGPDCTALITDIGAVYCCGRNSYNKLGLSNSFLHTLGFTNTIEKSPTLKEVKSLSSWRIVRISLAVNHSASLTECGRVITMGSNAESQTGHHTDVPEVVEAVQDRVATSVVCGPTYTVMTSVYNALYFWGTRYLNPASKGADSSATLALLHMEVARMPEEMLALYASPAQVARGEVVTVRDVSTLCDTVLVLVDTTAALARDPALQTVEYDSIGPIPEWITVELAQAEDQWDEQLFSQ